MDTPLQQPGLTAAHPALGARSISPLTLAAFILVASFSLASTAFAGCEKDTDCKGDRICTKGECVEPSSDSSASTPLRPRAQDPLAAARAEHARSTRNGAVTSIVGGAMTFTFGMVSATATENYWVSLGSGSAALLSAAITIPIGGGPAVRARNFLRSNGVSLRPSGFSIAGWVCYGFAIANGSVLVGLGIADAEVGAGPIISTTLLGTASAAFIAADALMLRTQLQQSGAPVGQRPRHPKVQIAVVPAIGPDLKQVALVGIF
ncbi:MAG: hypothetical protein VX498_05835 [Myxococcota bacterium]|nr:hypothetical protein [Myxococcota bacterium]